MVGRIENDPRYGGYLVTTMYEGDSIIIGDSIIRLKKVKSPAKVSVAVKAMKHVLVRRLDKDTIGEEADPEI